MRRKPGRWGGWPSGVEKRVKGMSQFGMAWMAPAISVGRQLGRREAAEAHGVVGLRVGGGGPAGCKADNRRYDSRSRLMPVAQT